MFPQIRMFPPSTPIAPNPMASSHTTVPGAVQLHQKAANSYRYNILDTLRLPG